MRPVPVNDEVDDELGNIPTDAHAFLLLFALGCIRNLLILYLVYLHCSI